MKRYLPLLIAVFLAGSCNNEPATTYMTSERAIFYFNTIKEICESEKAQLWGGQLCGPIMFVDRASRRIIASEPDSEGLLKFKDGVYTGTYPKEKIIDVIAVEYGKTFFAMVPIPATEDEYRIKAYAFHSLTHSVQKRRNLSPQSFNNRHLNDRNARMWLKLEWKALANALSSEGEQRDLAIRDALIFRGARHEAYPAYVNDETRFENYEGLATYTYTLLCTESAEDQKTRLLDGIKTYYNYRSYVYSYGFVHGAIYAFLLSEKGFTLESVTTDNTDLGALTAGAYNIVLPEIVRDVAGSIAINYDYEAIREEEAERERKIKDAMNKELSVYTEKPVVFFQLESPSFGFEPEDPNTLDTLGTIYKSIRVSDNWGKLTVNETGCLVSHNLKEIRVPAKNIKITRNHVTGEDWDLFLTDNWELVKGEKDYHVRRLSP